MRYYFDESKVKERAWCFEHDAAAYDMLGRFCQKAAYDEMSGVCAMGKIIYQEIPSTRETCRCKCCA